MTPQSVDLNGDGHADILTTTMSGIAIIIYGDKDGFEKPEHLKFKNGELLGLNEYSVKGKEGGVSRSLGDDVQGALASITSVDWDQDGDFDLVLGSYGNSALYLCTNEGTESVAEFSSKLKPILSNNNIFFHLTNPLAQDWDGDGLFDLICGTDGNGVKLFRNIGSRGKPKFEEPTDLLTPFVDTSLEQFVPQKSGEPLVPGGRFHIAIADYDKDGRLDLIIGAHSLIENRLDLSTKEKTRLAETKEELAEIPAMLAEAKSKNDEQRMEILLARSEELLRIQHELGSFPINANRIWFLRNEGVESRGAVETKTEASSKSQSVENEVQKKSGLEVTVDAPIKVASGDSFILTLKITIPDGYHIYGSRDQVMPTKLSFDETTGLSFSNPAVPIGVAHLKKGVVNYWLEGTQFIRTRVLVDEDADGEIRISGELAFMICDKDSCKPPATLPFEALVKVQSDENP